MLGPADTAVWRKGALQRHFALHGVEVRSGNPEDYDASARRTIRAGRRFTYEDRQSGLSRVGYFDATTGLFTALNERETEIMTHYTATRRYVRSLKYSTY